MSFESPQVTPPKEKPDNKFAQVWQVLGAKSLQDMSRLYDEEDQRLMKSNAWDYDNQALVIHQVKKLLEEIDPQGLTEAEQQRRNDILWIWYHHAISCAIWMKHDKASAKNYAQEALRYQSADHPNKITRLLALLVDDQLDEAEKWAATITDDVEGPTAQSVIQEYKDHGFFPK